MCEILECEDCGKKDDTVKETYCPYVEELYNKRQEAVLCDNCYHERCMDI